MSLADKSAAEAALDVAKMHVERGAHALYTKLGETMTFRDREKGFDEWDNLGDALKALSRAREKANNA